jgi:hypothetical protein
VSRYWHVITSELTKIRTVRSTTWALLLTPLICVGLGYAVSLSLRVSFPRLPAQQALGPHGTRAGGPGTLQAALGACLYLTLICAFAMGVTAITRSPGYGASSGSE